MYWWEVAEVCRRLALSGVLVLFGPGSVVQGAISLLICLASIKAYSLYQPFREDEDDYLQVRGFSTFYTMSRVLEPRALLLLTTRPPPPPPFAPLTTPSQELSQWQLFMVLFSALLIRVDAASDSTVDQLYLGWLLIAFALPGCPQAPSTHPPTPTTATSASQTPSHTPPHPGPGYVLMAWQCAHEYLEVAGQVKAETHRGLAQLRKTFRFSLGWGNGGRDPSTDIEMTSSTGTDIIETLDNPIHQHAADAL